MIVSQKQGWIRLHRSTMNSSVWKNPVVWMVWCWCLLRANHKKSTFPFNGADIEILPGQFISGRDSAIKELGTLTPQQWRTAIKYLKSTNRITIKSTNKFSLFTVIKWYEYQTDNQQPNQPLTNEQPATNQPLTTDKNVKKEENEKKESVEDSAPLPKTFKNFRDQARARIGNPPMEKMVLSEKQQGSVRSMKLLSRVHDAGIESGYDYLNEEDEQANKKYQGQVKPFEKRYPSYEEQEQYIKWFFNDNDNAWTNGHPSHFFSVSMWLKFDNRKNTKTNKTKGMAL